jgi:hypothetical protein
MLKMVRKTKPDLLLGSDSSVAHAGFHYRQKSPHLRRRRLSVIKNLAWLMIPFSSRFISPRICIPGPLRYIKNRLRRIYETGLSPPFRFSAGLSKSADLVKKNPYCIIRLASLTAHHDGQINGLNETLVRKIIQIMESKGFSS